MYFCAIPSSSPVQNQLSLTTPNFSLFVLELSFPNRKAEVIFHCSFWNFLSQIEKRKLYFTVCFGTSFPKSKSGSYISLFVFELSLPNQKEKADLPRFVLEQIEKPRTFRFGTCPPNRREDAKAEIGFTIRYGTWSRSRKDNVTTPLITFQSESKPETKILLSSWIIDSIIYLRNRRYILSMVGYIACHEELRFANLKLDRFSPGWRSQGQWAWCGRGIEVSTIQRSRRFKASN